MCEIDWLDGFAEEISTTERTARILHRCSGCGGPIPKGRKYVRRVTAYEGQLSTEKLCRPCKTDSDRFAKEHGWGFLQDWYEFLSECVIGDGDDADPRWRMMMVRADQRRKQWREVAE